MRLRHTVRLTQPNGNRIAVVDFVERAFEPGFSCGLDIEKQVRVKFHYHNILKTERVDEQGKVVETSTP